MPSIAKTATADLSRDGVECFQVDGEPFPWWVSEEGPSATKLLDDLYLIRVEIFVVSAGEVQGPETFYHEGLGQNGWSQPVIMGREFPWYISEDGFTYRSSGRIAPTVELEFLCASVEGIPVDGKIRDAGPYVIRRVATSS